MSLELDSELGGELVGVVVGGSARLGFISVGLWVFTCSRQE